VINYVTTPNGILCLGALAVLFLILLVLFGRRGSGGAQRPQGR
jgi:hypothetical protein